MLSLNLIEQALVTGVLTGCLYGLLALGLSLSWGLLKLVNIGHFAMALLGAYLTWWLGTSHGIPAWWSAAIVIPIFFVYGVGLHWVFVKFRVSEMSSMLITFALAIIVESVLQTIWSADFRRYATPLASESFHVSFLYVPKLSLIASFMAASLAIGTWAGLRYTYLGKALRACAEDAPIATAFGIDQRRLTYLLSGICAAYAAVAGVFIALIFTLAPSEIWGWIGIVFAIVIIGRLGNPLGALLGGILIGVCEAVTQAVVNPAWSPLVAFSVLILVLLVKPKWI
jgi:branched-chain amino acid transport system permease protein